MSSAAVVSSTAQDAQGQTNSKDQETGFVRTWTLKPSLPSALPKCPDCPAQWPQKRHHIHGKSDFHEKGSQDDWPKPGSSVDSCVKRRQNHMLQAKLKHVDDGSSGWWGGGVKYCSGCVSASKPVHSTTTICLGARPTAGNLDLSKCRKGDFLGWQHVPTQEDGGCLRRSLVFGTAGAHLPRAVLHPAGQGNHRTQPPKSRADLHEGFENYHHFDWRFVSFVQNLGEGKS